MKWSDDYATGIERIDDQHKWIFRMADDFSLRYAGGGYRHEDARDLVDTLDRWFVSHIAHVDVRLRESLPGLG
jgi:hemerythrin